MKQWLGRPSALSIALRSAFTRDSRPYRFVMPTLGLEAWYKADTGVTVATGVSQWDDQSGAGHHLLQATAANQPIYLGHTGTNYSYHSGVAGNYLSTPNAAANQITGDIDIRWYGTLGSLVPAAPIGFVNKWQVAANMSYVFYLNSNGTISFSYTSNGSTTTGRVATSTATLASVGILTNSLVWIRATYSTSAGTVDFYYSDDGILWHPIGAQRVITSGTIFAGTQAVEIGSWNTGTSGAFAGRTYRAQIYNGIGGTLVVDYNAEDYVSGSTLTSSTTGEVWTVNASGNLPCQIVDRSSLLFNGTSHFLKTLAFTLNQPETIYLACKQISWTSGDRILDGLNTNTAGLQQLSLTPQITFRASLLLPSNSNLLIGETGIICGVADGILSSCRVNNTTPVTGDIGTGSMGGVTVGAYGGGGGGWSNIQVYEAAIYSGHHSTEQQNRIISEMASKYGVSL